MKDAHARTIEDVLRAFDTDAEDGLTARAAAALLESYGPNELPTEKKPPVVLLFLKQFKSGLIYVLLGAALLSFASGHATDGIAILLVVILNATVGFSQERRAEGAIAKLRELVIQEVTVIRDGAAHRIPAAAVVPGDILLVEEGARIPADARVVECKDLRTNESSLTGESNSVTKSAAPVAADLSLADRKDMLWMGTAVTGGLGRAVVVETGNRTAFGAIASSLRVIRRERTPFEISVDKLGQRLGLLTVVLAAITFLLGYLRGFPPIDTFFFAVAMAVSVIPEGLPAVLVVVLAIGVQSMAKRNAIVRHLPSVETLGATDVICTDKTGTLTENKMTVREIVTADYAVKVTGEGWDTHGDFLIGDRRIRPVEVPVLDRLLKTAALCNRAALEWRGEKPVVIGDPTEAALVVLAEKAGLVRRHLGNEFRVLDEIPFTSERKYRAVLVEATDLQGRKSRSVLVVGAFEVIAAASRHCVSDLRLVRFGAGGCDEFEQANASMARRAMRVLAIATKEVQDGKGDLVDADVEGLTFVGLVGMIDPPRPGVSRAIARCREAGIRVIMITGDQRDTAVAIGREVGLIDGNADDRSAVFTEKDVAALDDAAFANALATAAVFARVTPETKLRIVSGLQRAGHTVAMTGDGVNDAPALKKASIGIAMGASGTDVSREVADMVLADDNFVSIVNAVEEGRVVFRNFKQTTAYLIMTNMGEAATILGSLLAGLPLPLLPAQVLWLNLVTDGFCDVALSTERTRGGDVLSEPPRQRNAPVVTANTMVLTFVAAGLMCAGTLAVFAWALPLRGLAYARSLAFVTLAMFQLWNVLNMRSTSASLFALGLRTNRYVLAAIGISLLLQVAVLYVPLLSGIFKTRPISGVDWLLAVVVTSSIFFAVEAYKLLVRKGKIPFSWL